jgi:hypothetical protein
MPRHGDLDADFSNYSVRVEADYRRNSDSAIAAKQAGNEAFRAGHHEEADLHYTRAMAFAHRCTGDAAASGPVMRAEASKLTVDLLNNAAINMLKAAERYGGDKILISALSERALQAAERALAIDCFNVKALYRRASAQTLRGDIGGARTTAAGALALAPTNIAIGKLIRRLGTR